MLGRDSFLGTRGSYLVGVIANLLQIFDALIEELDLTKSIIINYKESYFFSQSSHSSDRVALL